MADWSCDDWQAFHDHMPGKPHLLRVIGTCQAPRAGYEFVLRRKSGSQGFDPTDLLLELDVTEPEAGAEVITDYSVEYTEETDFEYASVTILGVTDSIEVQHTH
jgi:hypothetical protein